MILFSALFPYVTSHTRFLFFLILTLYGVSENGDDIRKDTHQTLKKMSFYAHCDTKKRRMSWSLMHCVTRVCNVSVYLGTKTCCMYYKGNETNEKDLFVCLSLLER